MFGQTELAVCCASGFSRRRRVPESESGSTHDVDDANFRVAAHRDGYDEFEAGRGIPFPTGIACLSSAAELKQAPDFHFFSTFLGRNGIPVLRRDERLMRKFKLYYLRLIVKLNE